MAEVRARAARHKGQLNFEQERECHATPLAPHPQKQLLTQSQVRNALYAYGDDPDSLPETVRVLDEIVTDFVIETCHTAARSATYSNRQKIKVDDFKFAVRRSDAMLGRLQERANMAAQMEKARRQLDDEFAEGRQGLERGNRLAKDAAADVDGGEAGGGRPRKKQKRKKGESTVVMES